MTDPLSPRLRAVATRLAQRRGRKPAPVRRPTPAQDLRCVHRGEPTGETVACPSCRGTVTLKVLACSVHGSCVVAKAVDGRACCATCPDRKAPESAPVEPRG